MPYILIIFSFLLIVASGCRNQVTESSGFEETVYAPRYSDGFRIDRQEGTENTAITVYNPWQGAEGVAGKLYILRDSTSAAPTDGQIIRGDAKRLVCLSSTHVGMLDAIDETDRIVALSGPQYVSNPKLRTRSDFIPDIGYDANIDYEAILSVNPDLVLLYSINGPSPLEGRLRQLGIPYMYVGDYVEESPLGKAEWLVALAEITGKREAGEKEFDGIAQRYEDLKATMADSTLNRPKVMLNAPYGDSWFLPSTESYVARMVKDAGGDYIYTKNTGNSAMPVDKEDAYRMVAGADFWINTGTVSSLNELTTLYPKFSDTPCVKEGKVYNNNKISTPGGGNDCFESGVVHPDLILRDLIKIFHPEMIEEDFVYYHQLK